MGRMIPGTIPSDASTGEKLVFSLLRNDRNCKDFIVVHSLFIADHLTAISGEIDFLVLAPGKGIFALEVKHGRVARNKGVWEFTNRSGNTSSSVRGPFRQASDAMHSLRKILQEKSSENSRLRAMVLYPSPAVTLKPRGTPRVHWVNREAVALEVASMLRTSPTTL